MIRFHNVSHHYGVRPVLKNVSLEVSSGELVAVMGPNGMGKSTLLGVAAGVLWPIKGFAEVNGLRRRASVDAELAIRRQTAYLPDHPWIPKMRSGREYLLEIGKLYNIDVDRLFEHIDQLLELFDLKEQADANIGSYSNGQKKKIAICGALVTDARVMILDEPFTGGLDPSGIYVLKKILQRMAERSEVTILMATQLPEIAEVVADRVAVVRNGELVAFNTPAELRRGLGGGESLQAALATMMSPKSEEHIRAYLERMR